MIESLRVLRGDRVVLRPLGPDDLSRCAKWFSDPHVTRFLGRSEAITLADEERWFREYERRPDEQIFGIVVDGAHVGNVGLHRVDRGRRGADLGILIGEPDRWSRGIGTDAIRAVLRYAFGELGLEKVSLDVLDSNRRAIHTYEKVGFVREGARREDVHRDGRRLDVVRMGILSKEFERTEASRAGPRARA